MILLCAVAGGLLAGVAWARLHRRPYRPPDLRHVWLVVVGFVPQLLIAYLPGAVSPLPRNLAAASLLASLGFFLAFVWTNRRLPGMPVLLVGLLLNLIVIAANGGWMPIGPGTARELVSAEHFQEIAVGERFSRKDIVLPPEQMRLGFLADRFLLPPWIPYRAAFSAGDILIALGVFWLLALPAAGTNHLTRSNK